MTDNKRQNKQKDVDMNAPPANGFSFGANQTGNWSNQQDEPRDLDGPGEAALPR